MMMPTAAEQSHWRDRMDDAVRWLHRALPLLIAFVLGFVSCVLLVTFAYR